MTTVSFPTARARRPACYRYAIAVLHAAAAVAAFPADVAVAATTADWTSPFGDWFSAANWSTGVVPGTSTIAQIDGGGTAYVVSGNAASYSTLRLGVTTGGDGSVYLSAGTLGTGSQYVGYAPTSTGTIYQTGGRNYTGGSIYLGYAAGSTGTYFLQTGSLGPVSGTAPRLIVGYSGTGVVNQSSGVARTSSTTLGGTLDGIGRYTLTGGTFAPQILSVATPASTFIQTDGLLTAGTIAQAAGLIRFDEADTFGGTISLPANARTYSLTGGTLMATNVLVQPTGTLTITSTGSVACKSITLAGGTIVLPDITLDSGSIPVNFPTPPGVPQPSLSHNSGTVAFSHGYLGSGPGPATLVHSRPKTMTYGFTDLYLAHAPGSSASFTLTDGTIVASAEYAGYSGPAEITQSGGSHAIGTLYLGYDPGSNASYTLASGRLQVNTERIGTTGPATFIQTGGDHSVSGFEFGPGGRYQLQGGSLHVDQFNYYPGIPITQSGGNFSFSTFTHTTGTLIAGTPESLLPDPLVLPDNTFRLPTGTFVATSINLTGTGCFDYNTHATLAVGSITLDGAYSRLQSDTIILDSGAPVIPFATPAGVAPPVLHLNGGYLAGPFRLGQGTTPVTFTQSTLTKFAPDTLRIGDTPGSNATYILPAGQTIFGGKEYVGVEGPGTFIQSGGTNYPLSLQIGSTGGGQPGHYSLHGGNFDVPTVRVANGEFAVSAGAVADASSFSNEGTVLLEGATAASPAPQFYTETFSQSAAGHLLIGIGGRWQETGYCTIHSSSAMSIDGSLTVVLTNGFVPQPGDVFELLRLDHYGRNFQGTFASASLPPGFAITYTAASVRLLYAPEPEAASLLIAFPLLRTRGSVRRRRAASRSLRSYPRFY